MQPPAPPANEIRDPVHGAVPIDPHEKCVVTHRAVQRLRGIRQLGFSHHPFPGATHTRFIHSLGAMHLAGQAFDQCFRDQPFSSGSRRRAFRHCVRLAALCHDLGHAPYSHAAEFAMPPLRDLSIAAYNPDAVAGRLDQRAHHEDYTIGVLTGTDLSDTIRRSFPFGPEHVAALISHDVQNNDDFFIDNGFDIRPLLSQLISSDLDIDRLDYLVRDSYYTGARYGQIDVHWLISSLTRHVDEQGRVCLALDSRALYAFDDYLVARFHMFLMVYFHQKSVAYEEMLRRYVEDGVSADGFRLPGDLDAYLSTDDAWMWGRLAADPAPFARRIRDNDPYRVAFESHLPPEDCALRQRADILRTAGIDVITTTLRGRMLMAADATKPALYLVERGQSVTRRLAEASRALHGGEDGVTISRLYVDPVHLGSSQERLRDVWRPRSFL